MTYLGLNGETVMCDDGYAAVERVNGAGGKVLRETYLNAEGQPIELKGGYAAVERDYDAMGNVIR